MAVPLQMSVLVFLPLIDVHPLQLGHIVQVSCLHLFHSVVVVNVVMPPLQAVDVHGERAADSPTSPTAAMQRGHFVILRKGGKKDFIPRNKPYFLGRKIIVLKSNTFSCKCDFSSKLDLFLI